MNIPIHAIIYGTTYQVTDWSTQGLNIMLSEEHSSVDFTVGDNVEIALMLPTGDSSILLQVEGIVKKCLDNTYGFELSKISDKNRRVLRHYATLAIEGSRDHVDDLSGNLFMTDVPTPIQEPILLTEKEHKEIHRSFLQRSFLYLIFGLLLMVTVLSTLLYNYIIIYESTGLIAGNAKNYKAPKDAKVKGVYVVNGQSVTPDQLLFEMDVQEEQEQLNGLELQQRLLEMQLQTTKESLAGFSDHTTEKLQEIDRITKQEKGALIAAYDVEKEAYERGSTLYTKQLITLQTYTDVQNQYFTFMSHYNDVVLRNKSTSRDRALADQELFKSQDHIITLQRSLDKLNIDIEINALEMTTLQQQVQNASVLADEYGTVHNIFHNSGDFLEYSDDVLSLETDETPYLLTKMLADEIASIHLGGACILYSQRENRSYRGHIAGIGYSVTEGSTTNTTEISQQEIPIRIEFEDVSLRFHLNEYLEVYLINDSAIAKSIVDVLPQELLTL